MNDNITEAELQVKMAKYLLPFFLLSQRFGVLMVKSELTWLLSIGRTLTKNILLALK